MTSPDCSPKRYVKPSRQSSRQDQDIARLRAHRTLYFSTAARLDSSLSSAVALRIARALKAAFYATAAGTNRLMIATFTVSFTPRHMTMA
jgi:hypothetical protein